MMCAHRAAIILSRRQLLGGALLNALRRNGRGPRLALALAAFTFATGTSAREIAEGLDPSKASTWQLPGADLYGVAAIGDSAWAVGYWGTALHSEDFGKTWAPSGTPTEATLFGVSFADPQHGWAVGERGTILRSDDGGKTWTPQSATVADPAGGGDRPLDTHLFGISAVSPSEAWAVGDLGVVLHTTDAGANWVSSPIPPEAFADENFPERILNAVCFTDPQHGWITGEFATTLRTTDGGATWVGQRKLVDTAEDLYLFDLSAQTEGRAAATGLAGGVLLTSDGGSTWEPHTAPTAAGLFGVAWSGSNGIVIGDRGEMFLTLDDGATWQRPERPKLFNWIRSVTFADHNHAYAVGERGLVLASEDGGLHWTQERGQTPTPRAGVSVPEPGRSTEPGRKNLPPAAGQEPAKAP
jgi:photosystem II stability/assembly factor-like uncharacterized protein